MAVGFATRSGAAAVGTLLAGMCEADALLLSAHESGCVLVWAVTSRELLQEASIVAVCAPVCAHVLVCVRARRVCLRACGRAGGRRVGLVRACLCW